MILLGKDSYSNASQGGLNDFENTLVSFRSQGGR